jgi:hypothetical protein
MVTTGLQSAISFEIERFRRSSGDALKGTEVDQNLKRRG